MKIELDLPDKPEVHYIAGALSMDPATVVGHLVKAWAWFDKHTQDGHAYGVTHLVLDRVTGVTGLGEAMTLAGWLEQDDKTLIMPKFDRHTSESAKKRALSQKRKSRQRHAASVTQAGPEKRREEKKKDIQLSKTAIPKDFVLSDRMRSWAEDNGICNITQHYEYFVNSCKAKAYRYVDWDRALMNAVRSDWAKIGTGQPQSKRVAI